MDKNKDKEPSKSTLGDRMGDISGLRVLRNGKWVLLSEISKSGNKEKPKP